MKTKTPVPLLIGWLGLTVVLPRQAAYAADVSATLLSLSQGTGTIAGLVSSTKTGTALQGAIVEIPALLAVKSQPVP